MKLLLNTVVMLSADITSINPKTSEDSSPLQKHPDFNQLHQIKQHILMF